MVDFGLIGLFALQCGMVFLCYVAYNRISTKILELKALEKTMEGINGQLTLWEARSDTMGGRISDLEKAPAANKKRHDEADNRMDSQERQIAHLEKKLASTAARISTSARWNKRAKDEEDTDPAPEGEGNDGQIPMFPPGSHPPQATPEAPAVSRGFGVMKRRVGNG